jgi:hypothetical protein
MVFPFGVQQVGYAIPTVFGLTKTLGITHHRITHCGLIKLILGGFLKTKCLR